MKASPVRFEIGDCRRTSLPAETFDTAFMSLVIHFTCGRILKPGGTLIISNPDVYALRGLDLIRCQIRVIYRGLTDYRMKPPKGFGKRRRSDSAIRLANSNSRFSAQKPSKIRPALRTALFNASKL